MTIYAFGGSFPERSERPTMLISAFGVIPFELKQHNESTGQLVRDPSILFYSIIIVFCGPLLSLSVCVVKI